MTKKTKIRRMTASETSSAASMAISGDTNAVAVADQGGVEAFTFGEPESVLDRRSLLDMLQVYRNDRWYEPPL